MQNQKPTALIVAKLPPDLRTALGAEYELVDYPADAGSAGPFPRMPGFPMAVTMVYSGANAGLMDALPDLKLIASGGPGNPASCRNFTLLRRKSTPPAESKFHTAVTKKSH